MSQIITCIIILTVLGTLFGIGFGDQNDHNNGGQYLRYARELLLSLRPRSASPQPSFAAELPPECECARNTVRRHRLRKRGRRRGVRQRFRRRSTRPPLPGVILGNVLSLRSRMDELHAIVKFLTEYRDANLLCFSEMWLDDTIASWHVHVDGFGAPPHNHPDCIPKTNRSNFCTNFMFSSCTKDDPWCYTMDPDKEWDYCDIPSCSE
ncbi:hypothetical protein NP493_984g00012 [Ridgeia piscesae]|uniref:Kringle domain-containing protein n=1 Tax=Ridgeia piscesae TaxID=27915 RepID=A0AAD9KIW6_RIDPI|nr:hypothetical protein NP493_984g00012 [Ridgeia piscesae]